MREEIARYLRVIDKKSCPWARVRSNLGWCLHHLGLRRWMAGEGRERQRNLRGTLLHRDVKRPSIQVLILMVWSGSNKNRFFFYLALNKSLTTFYVLKLIFTGINMKKEKQ